MTFTIRERGDTGALIVAEFRCPEHGRFGVSVRRAEIPDEHACPACGASAPWTISAPGLKFPIIVDVHRGKSDEKPHPMACDTEALADGMDLSEWKAKRAAAWRSHDYDEWKANT